jgi:hypothetical protein
MHVLPMPREYIDISEFWPPEKSVNAIASEIVKTDLELNRHTLSRAKTGQLEKCEVSTIRRLLLLCSRWAGRTVRFEDISKVEATP